MDQIPTNYCDRSVCEPDGNLGKIIKSGKGRYLLARSAGASHVGKLQAAYRERLSAILYAQSRLAGWQTCLLYRFIQGPYLQNRFIGQVFLQDIRDWSKVCCRVCVNTDIVTNKEVPSTCFICVMEPTSYAWKVRRILKFEDTIRTTPSSLPRKRFSDPEQTHLISLLSKNDRLSSSGGFIWETSKKSNVFHWTS